jgi:hypothetical protein
MDFLNVIMMTGFWERELKELFAVVGEKYENIWDVSLCFPNK